MGRFLFTKDKNKDLDNLDFFLDPNTYFFEDVSKDIYKDHSVLADKNTSREKYVDEYYSRNSQKIDDYVKEIDTDWQGRWEKIQNILSDILKTDWDGIDTISCNVGIARVYPRDLEKNELSICYLDSIEDSEAVILHEVTHFIYFKKWREMFPDDKESDFEAPLPFWHLSEIVAPIIDGDNRLTKLVPKAVNQSYPEYDKFFDEFKEAYLKSESIEDYLKSAREKIFQIKP